MTHPVHAAVAELVRTRTLHIDITPQVGYTVRAPCLLAQLAEAIGLGSETGGRGIPSSRCLLAVDAWDLWREILFDTHAWAAHLGIDRARYREPAAAQHGVPGTPPVGRLLRAVAAQAVSIGQEPIADRLLVNARRWRAQIEGMLTGQVEQRSVRGARCGECWSIEPYPMRQVGPRVGPQHTSTMIEWREEDGRQVPYRVPAIVLVVRDGGYGLTLRWLVCQACGWSQSLGEELDSLAVEAA